MNAPVAKTLALLLFVLFGTSFLPFLSDASMPYVVAELALSVSLSLLLGFRLALPVVISLGFLSDLALLGVPGVLSAFSVLVAYAAGFFSRRVALDHGLLFGLLGGIAISLSTITFRFAAIPFGGNFHPDSSGILLPFAYGIILFPLVFLAVRRFLSFVDAFDVPMPARR